MDYDVIIVGAGSAGCVLATRLTEDPNRGVLLLEAGPDYAGPAQLPEDIANSYLPPQSHDWGYVSQPDERGQTIPLVRGKIVGGSSAVNYCYALRARRSDFDGWAALGNEGWSFDDVLPAFKGLENDPDGEDRWHGRGGPLSIRRYASEELTPAQGAFLRACRAAGYPSVEDQNAPDTEGAGITPLTQVDGVRQSASLAYLSLARGRPNLVIRADTEVDRVVFEGGRAVGVKLAGSEEVVRAGRVVLSAGAYDSPAILLRSGVGPAEHLRDLGVGVVEDRPGVGRNLTNHPAIWMVFAAAPQEEAPVPLFQTTLITRVGQDSPDPDAHVAPASIAPSQGPGPHPTGFDLVLFSALLTPESRGEVRLNSVDPSDPPLIDEGIYTHPSDARRMAEVARLARRLAETAPLSDYVVEELAPGKTVPDDQLEEAVRSAPANYAHPVGTCRMGPETDEGAVVDAKGNVHGVEGLSVVDASIMPTVPRANTNLSTIMIAERCSEFLVEALTVEGTAPATG